MKLTYEDINKYIDDYINDQTRDKFPEEQRLRTINSQYFSILSDIDKLKGVRVTKTQGDDNKTTISFAVNDTIKNLDETTEINEVTMSYDGSLYTLERVYPEDIENLEEYRAKDASRPKYYILSDDSIEVLPKTDKDMELYLSQTKRPDEFDGTATQLPRLNEDIHDLIAIKTIIRYMTMRDMAVPQILLADELIFTQKMKNIYSPNRRFKISYASDSKKIR